MVEDSGVRLLLADSAAAEAVAGAAEVVRVDRGPEAKRARREPIAAGARSVARVHHVHVGLHRKSQRRDGRASQRGQFLRRHGPALGTRAGVWLAVTSLSFDISVLELFWTLTHGYTVVLYSSRMALGERTHARRQARRCSELRLVLFCER